jgi:long-subunit acyl-CoA synthetase (AMP-forming)
MEASVSEIEKSEGVSNCSSQPNNTPEVTITETPQMRDAESFLDIFYQRVALHPNKCYLRQAKGNIWEEYSWADVYHMASRLVTALRSTGLQQGDHIGIISKNCYPWIVADLAIMMGGFVSVPFYPTLSGPDLAEVIELSHIKALFVGKLEHWDQQKSSIKSGLTTIAFPYFEGNDDVRNDCTYKWEEIQNTYDVCADLYQPSASDIFTIIYTSGTTGTPKGVMIDYNCLNEVMRHEREAPAYGVFQGVSERVVSYLPLNHIAERVVSEVSPIVAGSEVSFSESLDRFASNLQSVQPTQFFAVPRIWTKIQQGILSKLPEKKLNTLLRVPLLKSILKKKIKQGIGLGQVRSAISGAAPLSASLIHWYANLGITIQEVYGATELCGGVTYNSLDNVCPGTVGKPLNGVEVQIDSNSDEVMIKAPWVMKGYYNAPDKTAEVLSEDGWYQTGDTGRLDEAGNLKITGRIKDTFKTAKGKFVVPVPIEQIMGGNFYAEQVMVTGFGLVQPIALVSLSEAALEGDPSDVEQSLLNTLQSTNANLEAYAKLSHVFVFRSSWSEDSGFFTPTLKIKRHIVDQAFSENYEEWCKKESGVYWV